MKCDDLQLTPSLYVKKIKVFVCLNQQSYKRFNNKNITKRTWVTGSVLLPRYGNYGFWYFFIIVGGLNVSWVISCYNCHCLLLVPLQFPTLLNGPIPVPLPNLDAPSPLLLSSSSHKSWCWLEPYCRDPNQTRLSWSNSAHIKSQSALVSHNDPHWRQTSPEFYYTLIWTIY